MAQTLFFQQLPQPLVEELAVILQHHHLEMVETVVLVEAVVRDLVLMAVQAAQETHHQFLRVKEVMGVMAVTIHHHLHPGVVEARLPLVEMLQQAQRPEFQVVAVLEPHQLFLVRQ